MIMSSTMSPRYGVADQQPEALSQRHEERVVHREPVDPDLLQEPELVGLDRPGPRHGQAGQQDEDEGDAERLEDGCWRMGRDGLVGARSAGGQSMVFIRGPCRSSIGGAPSRAASSLAVNPAASPSARSNRNPAAEAPQETI